MNITISSSEFTIDELLIIGDDKMSYKLVVLGGGYGGLALINELLDKGLPKGTTITLVDRSPFQGLKTEFYSLAAGTVSDLQLRVAFPNSPSVNLALGEITEIDRELKVVHVVGHDPIQYDSLVIGLGCVDHYHGVEGAPQYANSLQTFQAARKAYTDLNNVKPYGQVTIVGGGLSGVEMASELRESRPDLNIALINRGPNLLGSFPSNVQTYVAEWFQEHNVNMLINTALHRIEPGLLYAESQSDPIEANAILWTAGIQPVALVQQLQAAKDKQGRLIVNDQYQLPDDPNIYVIGDCVSSEYSPSAQVAGLQGERVAKILHAIWHNHTIHLEPFKLRGTLGALGKHNGFGVMGKLSMRGRIPRLIKSGVLWRSKHL